MSQLIKIAAWSNAPRAVVIFVHGLGGHPYDTWRRAADDSSFWPTWLAKDIPGLAIWPKLTAKIEFRGITDDGRLRHPSFKGLA